MLVVLLLLLSSNLKKAGSNPSIFWPRPQLESEGVEVEVVGVGLPQIAEPDLKFVHGRLRVETALGFQGGFEKRMEESASFQGPDHCEG